MGSGIVSIVSCIKSKLLTPHPQWQWWISQVAGVAPDSRQHQLSAAPHRAGDWPAGDWGLGGWGVRPELRPQQPRHRPQGHHAGVHGVCSGVTPVPVVSKTTDIKADQSFIFISSIPNFALNESHKSHCRSVCGHLLPLLKTFYLRILGLWGVSIVIFCCFIYFNNLLWCCNLNHAVSSISVHIFLTEFFCLLSLCCFGHFMLSCIYHFITVISLTYFVLFSSSLIWNKYLFMIQ